MGKYLHFEELEIWKEEAMRICKEVYFLFKECRDYGLKDQIQRAAVSVPSNIAEGYERKTIKDTTHFLFIAKGSCGEMRTQLYLSIALELIDKQKGLELITQSKSLSVKIYNFIQSINKEEDKSR
jgi:four helix bundle protein